DVARHRLNDVLREEAAVCVERPPLAVVAARADAHELQPALRPPLRLAHGDRRGRVRERTPRRQHAPQPVADVLEADRTAAADVLHGARILHGANRGALDVPPELHDTRVPLTVRLYRKLGVFVTDRDGL